MNDDRRLHCEIFRRLELGLAGYGVELEASLPRLAPYALDEPARCFAAVVPALRAARHEVRACVRECGERGLRPPAAAPRREAGGAPRATNGAAVPAGSGAAGAVPADPVEVLLRLDAGLQRLLTELEFVETMIGGALPHALGASLGRLSEVARDSRERLDRFEPG